VRDVSTHSASLPMNFSLGSLAVPKKRQLLQVSGQAFGRHDREPGSRLIQRAILNEMVSASCQGLQAGSPRRLLPQRPVNLSGGARLLSKSSSPELHHPQCYDDKDVAGKVSGPNAPMTGGR
jgi:hypothetical protein